VTSPYRTPPGPPKPDDEQEISAVAALVVFVVLLSVLIGQFAPRNRSEDSEPVGHGHGGYGGHAFAGGRR
jgi:hypothetical protein